MSTSADIQDRPTLPLAGTCCAPLLREPITAGQAACLARLLKALANPTRLRLVFPGRRPRRRPGLRLRPHRAARPDPAHHLKILVGAGIFTRDKRGVWATTPSSPGP